jgi:hypothetical protein
MSPPPALIAWPKASSLLPEKYTWEAARLQYKVEFWATKMKIGAISSLFSSELHPVFQKSPFSAVAGGSGAHDSHDAHTALTPAVAPSVSPVSSPPLSTA